MKTTAIICEFNPLHSGHKKLIDYAKSISDRVICIMSGNFTQRGMPACCDKYLRAAHAVKAGADLVVELPTIYATASAENFAYGGVAIADSLGVDSLLFGSECGDIDELRRCAKLLTDKDVNAEIARMMTTGISYPTAVAAAVGSDALNSPNNVLAVEYIRALQARESSVLPVTIKRENNFNGEPTEYASSGYLRQNADDRERYSYDFVIRDIDDSIENKYKEFAARAVSLLSAEQLAATEGVTEGLENRIFKADKSNGYDAMLEQIKTKRYTRMKLQRIILNAVLSVTKDKAVQSKNAQPKIKALAVHESAVTLLRNLDEETDELTRKADRLYYTLSASKPPQKLIKLS